MKGIAMRLGTMFHDHPASVDETYLEHMGTAFGFGWRMLAAGLACVVHGLLPFAFTSTGSRTITILHDRMVANRNRHSKAAAMDGQALAGD